MKFKSLILLLISFISFSITQCLLITQFKLSKHSKDCYTQGIFFLNQTHVFQSCGLYNKSYFHVFKYQQIGDEYQLEQVFKSQYPINQKVFLEGATYFPKTNKIYVLTWRQGIVYKINANTFQIQEILKWKKDGWGLTNNQTHLFITDGGSKIYLVDQHMNILSQKIIFDRNRNKLHNINQLQLVKQSNGKQYIFANVYMERRLVKIDFQSGKVVQQYDAMKMIQNQKRLKYDQVINGIAYIPSNNKFLLTGKNWQNFYRVNLNQFLQN